MKIALGLFHFNVQYVAGDVALYHRYCAQAVIPFLETISANERYRISFEMAGSGLEFLSHHYPHVVDLLRDLIDRGQVELISSLYAPTMWVAFPKRDLIRSIEINRACLGELGLSAAEIFFAQEAFFGPGLKEVSHLFKMAMCKDDYLRFFCEAGALRPIYRLGNLRVVVGCNHLLNELRRRRLRPYASTAPSAFSAFHQARLQTTATSVPPASVELVSGSIQAVEWYWYHMGSGHHFTAWSSPEDWEAFFADAEWTQFNTQLFEDLISEGYQLGTITEFVESINPKQDEMLPGVIEGSWNSERGSGVYSWMGKQEHPWENGPGILGLAWRSRTEVRKCETAIEGFPDPKADPSQFEALDNLWKQQLLAESSDPLGWAPVPNEVMSGRINAEKTLQICSRFMSHMTLAKRVEEAAELEHNPASALAGYYPAQSPLTSAELLGGVGTVRWISVDDGIQLCEAQFRATNADCGIRFMRTAEYLAYCPSGMEWEPVKIDLSAIRPTEFYLPLANGLISLGDDLHLIRANRFGQVAARISQADQWVVFLVRGSRKEKVYRWRFTVVRGDVETAVKIANRENYI